MVVDIFTNEKGYLPAAVLLHGCIEEIGSFLLHFLILCGIFLLAKRFHSRWLTWLTALFMPVLQLLFVWNASIRSEFFLSTALAVLLTAQIWILRLIPFRREDYLFLFSAFLFPARLFNTTSVLLGHLWLFWLIFCVFYTAAKLSLGSLRGSQFYCYISFVTLSLSAYLFFLAAHFAVPYLQRITGKHALGIIGMTACFIPLFFAAAAFLRFRFSDPMERLNLLGKRYAAIEHYYFFFSGLILLFCTVIFLPFSILSSQNTLVLLLFPSLCLMFLGLQLLFIRLLFRVAFYKDSAAFNQLEKEGISSYYQNLGETLTPLQNIRHDIKNIFFTMGNFVNDSDNAEMKRFFWEKIYPYSQDTIRQSQLLSSICQLPSEPLQAFFFLKLSQALQQKIQVSLNVQVLPEDYQAGMDLIDLTRVLGILMDNAIEEARQLPDGIIEVRITGKPYGCSYTIKNSVTNRTLKKGVHAGTTTKG